MTEREKLQIIEIIGINIFNKIQIIYTCNASGCKDCVCIHIRDAKAAFNNNLTTGLSL